MTRIFLFTAAIAILAGCASPGWAADQAVKRLQVDEIWAFCYAKQKNVATAKRAPEGAGDIWTWTAIDAASDTKLRARLMSAQPRQ